MLEKLFTQIMPNNCDSFNLLGLRHAICFVCMCVILFVSEHNFLYQKQLYVKDNWVWKLQMEIKIILYLCLFCFFIQKKSKQNGQVISEKTQQTNVEDIACWLLVYIPLMSPNWSLIYWYKMQTRTVEESSTSYNCQTFGIKITIIAYIMRYN